jgi:hypothetical protein
MTDLRLRLFRLVRPARAETLPKKKERYAWLGDLDSNQDYRSQSRFPGPMVSADSAPHLSPTITIALPWTAPSFAAVKGIIHAPGAFAPHLPVAAVVQ